MTGTYAAEISRSAPGCILFLLDQSGSMAEECAGDPAHPKANVAADAINKLLMNLVLRCTQNIGEGPRDYFEVGVVGYGSAIGVGPALGGALAGRELVSVRELADNHLRVEQRTRRVADGVGGLVDSVVKFPVWFDPVAHDGTPMREAMELAARTLTSWTASHPGSYPPIVINITDGEPNDDPTAAAKSLMTIRTKDGDSLLYNVHLSRLPRHQIQFPSGSSGLPDSYARMLFEISSEVPPKIVAELELEGFAVQAGARGFIFNADSVALIQFLDIGTRLALEGLAGNR